MQGDMSAFLRAQEHADYHTDVRIVIAVHLRVRNRQRGAGCAINWEAFTHPLIADRTLVGRVDSDREGRVAAFLNRDIVRSCDFEWHRLRIDAVSQIR